MSSLICQHLITEYILALIGPNNHQNVLRENKYLLIKKIIQEAFDGKILQEWAKEKFQVNEEYEEILKKLEVKVYCFGSYPLKMYLPDSDLDVTALFINKQNGQPYVDYSNDMLYYILFKIQLSMERYNNLLNQNSIVDITLVNADIRLLKCKIDNLPIDISINNYMGLCKLSLMNIVQRELLEKKFNKNLDKEFLLQKTLFLIKTWYNYESYLLGSNVGLMASYALEVMLIYFFNIKRSTEEEKKIFSNEFNVFKHFTYSMNELDFDNNIITVSGLISKQEYLDKAKKEENFVDSHMKENQSNIYISVDSVIYVKEEFSLLKDLDKIQNFNLCRKHIHLKHLNIIDPLHDGNNLGKSMNYNSFTRFKLVVSNLAEWWRSIDTMQAELDREAIVLNDNGNNFDNNSNINNQVELKGDYKPVVNNEENINLKIQILIEYLNKTMGLFHRTIVLNTESLNYVIYSQPQIVISSTNYNNNDAYYNNSINNNNELNNFSLLTKNDEYDSLKFVKSNSSEFEKALRIIIKECLNSSFNKLLNNKEDCNLENIDLKVFLNKLNQTYLYSNYTWPNILEVRGDRDKNYLIKNLGNPSLGSLNYLTEETLEFISKYILMKDKINKSNQINGNNGNNKYSNNNTYFSIRIFEISDEVKEIESVLSSIAKANYT